MPTSNTNSYWIPANIGNITISSDDTTTSVAATQDYIYNSIVTPYTNMGYSMKSSDSLRGLCDFICHFDNSGCEQEEEEIQPVRLVRNNGATIVYWNDGTKTVVRLCKEDSQNGSDSNYTAFCIALAKKIFGSNSAIHRLVKQIDDENIKAKAAEEAQKELESKRERERINHDRKVRRIAKELRIMDEANKLLVDEYERDKYE